MQSILNRKTFLHNHRIETFIYRKTDATSSNALEAKKEKVEGHAGSKSKFSACKGRYTVEPLLSDPVGRVKIRSDNRKVR